MNRFNRHPSRDYSGLKSEIQAYADADTEPGEDVLRAVADALADELRDRFKQYWGVDEPAATPCLRRVITGEDECNCAATRGWIAREEERAGERDEPPHAPPARDHATLWLADGEPVLYSMHPYTPELVSVSKAVADEGERQRNSWFDLVAVAETWGLEIGVTPFSWHNAFSTVNIVLFAPEWGRG